MQHEQRMLHDVTLPFVAGMLSIAWALWIVGADWPEPLVLLSLPGTFYAGWKLAPFLWAGEG